MDAQKAGSLAREPWHGLLGELRDVRVKGDAGKVPDLLYHYSSASTLAAVAISKSLWLTNLRHMNDARELRHGAGIVTAVLDARIAALKEANRERKLLEPVRSAFADRWGPSDLYAFCLSEKGDDLSQWRAYAQGGRGYALAFEAHLLQARFRNWEWSWETRRQPAEPVLFGRVLYDEEAQRNLVKRTVRRALGMLTEKGASHQKAILDALTVALHEAIPFMKHASFEPEAEWRVVVTAEPDPTRVLVRTRDDRLYPYVVLRCRCAAGAGEGPALVHAKSTCLPLRRIRCGRLVPLESERPGIDLLRMLLADPAVDVDQSVVPMQ